MRLKEDKMKTNIMLERNIGIARIAALGDWDLL